LIGTKADAVVSDMAANTTGNKDLDCIRTNALCAEVIEFSRFILKKNGVVISKLFNGTDFLEVKKLAESKFQKVNFFKPESSRDYSKETYIHCVGIKTL
jgi:23S rRNA (uridine2552-2'-O)-methyltransferase